MEDNTEKEKSGWSGLMIAFFIIVVIAIPTIKRTVSTAKMDLEKESLKDNTALIKNDSNTSNFSDSTKCIFKYDKVTYAQFEGESMVSSYDTTMEGYVVIKKEKLRIGHVLSPEDFYINDYMKTSNGGYLFNTYDESDEECTVSVFKNKGQGLVVIHYLEDNLMIYLYVDKGFTLDFKFL